MRRKMSSAVSGLLVALVAGCGAAGAGAPAAAGGDGTLTFASTLAHTTLDPDRLPVNQMAMYTSPLYDRLTRLTSDESVKPMLTTEWHASKDAQGFYLDMTLREGLTFDDGTPFTAKTVALNIERSQNLEQSTNARDLASVTVEILDKYQVRFRREEGVGALPRILAGPSGMMVSNKAIKNQKDLTSAEAGIGAFNLKSIQSNRVVYSAANPGYWDEDATAVDTLVIEYLSDSAKLNAVRSGEVDVTVLPPDMGHAAESAGYRVEYSPSTSNYVFVMNREIEPFDDPKVRKAVNLSLDRKAICQGVLGGHCVPTGQLFGAGSAEYDPDAGIKNFPHNLEDAKALIKKVGVRGASVDIVTVSGNKTFEQLAAVLQAQLKKLGLDANVLSLSPPQVVSRFRVKKNVAIGFGALGTAFDPSVSLSRYALPSGPYNPGKFKIESIVERADDAVREINQEKRKAIYREISTMIAPRHFIVPLLTPKTTYAVAEHVTGWETPWGPSFPNFRGVSG